MDNIHFQSKDPFPETMHQRAIQLYYDYLMVGGMPADVLSSIQSQYGDAIDWLIRSGIVLQCTKCEQGYMPPSAYRDLSSFKLYFSDIGLLFKKSNMRMDAVVSGEHNLFKGALVENYIACSLKSNGYELLYWTSGNTAEADFVIVKDNAVIPVESKDGTHVKAKSLMVFKQKYMPPYGIRISERNFGLQNEIKSVPLYAVFCI